MKGGLNVSSELSEQYDKIYRYCYVRVHSRETAEDLTQETFLRYLEHPQYSSSSKTMQLLYTIAGNLCTDHFRKHSTEELPEDLSSDEDLERSAISGITLRQALSSLDKQDRDMVLLRYVNEEPIGVISQLMGISRFAVNRRLSAVLKKLRESMGKEESD
jgi:RNA polymerase sigma-70 factor (ECF subfamily)